MESVGPRMKVGSSDSDVTTWRNLFGSLLHVFLWNPFKICWLILFNAEAVRRITFRGERDLRRKNSETHMVFIIIMHFTPFSSYSL